MLSPPLLFTGDGSSRPRRTKAKSQRGNPRYDEAQGQFIVPPSNRKQQARDAAYMRRDQERAEREERAKRAKYDNLQSLNKMSKVEFRELRKTNFYALPRTSDDPRFWRKEQCVFMKDVYGVLTKSPVCPQKFMNIEQMRQSPYFNDALWICEKLGLYNLMELREDYSVHLVQQFYATAVFGTDIDRTMVWMTGTTRCTATFHDFANVIFETFHGISTPMGLRMHSAALGENKRKLAPLYDDGVVGASKGLKPLYNL